MLPILFILKIFHIFPEVFSFVALVIMFPASRPGLVIILAELESRLCRCRRGGGCFITGAPCAAETIMARQKKKEGKLGFVADKQTRESRRGMLCHMFPSVQKMGTDISKKHP